MVSATNYFLSIIQISTWRLGLKKLFSISHCQSVDIWEAQKCCFFHLWLATIPPNNWHALLNFIMFYLQHSAKGSMCVYAHVLVHAYLFVKHINAICLLQCSNPGLKNPLKLYWLYACQCQHHSWQMHGIHTFILAAILSFMSGDLSLVLQLQAVGKLPYSSFFQPGDTISEILQCVGRASCYFL